MIELTTHLVKPDEAGELSFSIPYQTQTCNIIAKATDELAIGIAFDSEPRTLQSVCELTRFRTASPQVQLRDRKVVIAYGNRSDGPIALALLRELVSVF